MKNRFWLLIIVLVTTIVAVVFWHLPATQPATPEPTQENVQSADILVAVTNSLSNSLSVDALPIISQPLAQTPLVMSNNGTIDPRELQLQEGFEAKNIPLNFYGQVLNQDGQPISGAQIRMSGEHVFYLIAQGIASTNIEMKTLTDSDGRFEWTDAKGDALTVESVEKAGYKLSPNAAHNFAPSSGSFAEPVIFKMWKLGEKAQLVAGDKFWGIIPDGRIYTIDLLQGTKEESANANGDFRISITRPAGVSRQDHYNWSFQITPIDGGIMETEDDFMYLAPELGYAAKFDFLFDTSRSSWTYTVKKSFYIKTRGGQTYGRINIEVFPHYKNQGVLDIKWSVNPNGSRNLQP